MQHTLLKQEQTFLWYRECICLSRITLHCAVTELLSVHLSMPHFPVLKKRCISRTLHPFSEKTMRFEQRGAVPRKICCSLSSSVSLALSYSLCHSFSFSSLSLSLSLSWSPHVPVAVCVKYLENPFGFLSYKGPGSVTAWPKEAFSFP